VAAGGATAAATGCQRTSETILPLVVPNEQIVPGVAAWFATGCRGCPAGCGVIARNREGRVVKLEGNPDHPVNQGALCARGQAALQGLYHPDRFAGPRLRDGATLKPVPWDVAQKVVVDKLTELRSAAKGQAIAVVTQLEHSRLGALVDRWTQALGTRPRVTFEPFGYEALRAANRITFGRDGIPYYAFEDAEVLLSFGADFLETWLSNVNYARTFARMHTFRDGLEREGDPRRHQPPECGRGQRRQDRALRPRFRVRQGDAVRRNGPARRRDGERGDRGAAAGQRRQPRVHAPGRSPVRRRREE